ncbi:jg22919 [Pararge aegeria aegeria]|uniref:Jg22919 protein n=1 Tax=Pararge aegeria aegeria TaxID=348720 RepID=A0A8S4QS68_9NEOP|nr:jg22919 [Pararge aegeria aegeria]
MYQHNPFPFALWAFDAEGVPSLVNAEEIMPANYAMNEFLLDIEVCQQSFESINRKYPKRISSAVSYELEGHKSIAPGLDDIGGKGGRRRPEGASCEDSDLGSYARLKTDIAPWQARPVDWRGVLEYASPVHRTGGDLVKTQFPHSTGFFP